MPCDALWNLLLKSGYSTSIAFSQSFKEVTQSKIKFVKVIHDKSMWTYGNWYIAFSLLMD